MPPVSPREPIARPTGVLTLTRFAPAIGNHRDNHR
jgi:hypothetical protein